MTAPRMNLQAFVDQFLEAHRLMDDVRYCWVIGAGASISSDIAGGEVFARRWLDQVYQAEKVDGESLEDFAKRLPSEAQQRNIDLADFSFQSPGTHYSELYDYRFRDDPTRGFAQLEEAMRGKDPGLGYAVLARFLSQTRHRVVITVNFDNLVADAVAIHTDVFPLVVGHESLANYIKLKQARPLVLKVHRDLLLDPMSRSVDLDRLQRQWPPLLKSIFNEYTPIVIGYDGNDRTLMRFLADHEPLDGRLYWCHMSNQLPRAEIHELVSKHRGRLVAIEGFDELLFRLGGPLGFTDPLTAMRSRYEKRALTYTTRLGELDKKTRAQAATSATAVDAKPLRVEVKKAVEEAAKEENWWNWSLKAQEERDLTKREAIIREGIAACPKSGELLGDLAIILTDNHENYPEVEQLFRQGLELLPNAAYYCLFGMFLLSVKQDRTEAERVYRQGLALNPMNGIILGAFGHLAGEIGDDDEAQRLFRRALEASSDSPIVVYEWAQFLTVQGNLEEAERQAKRAWETVGDGQAKAFASYLCWLLAHSYDESTVSTESALGRLKTILLQDFDRGPWSFNRLLSTTVPIMPKSQQRLALKLADALLDKSKVQALEKEPIWVKTQPIRLDVPWTN